MSGSGYQPSVFSWLKQLKASRLDSTWLEGQLIAAGQTDCNCNGNRSRIAVARRLHIPRPAPFVPLPPRCAWTRPWTWLDAAKSARCNCPSCVCVCERARACARVKINSSSEGRQSPRRRCRWRRRPPRVLFFTVSVGFSVLSKLAKEIGCRCQNSHLPIEEPHIIVILVSYRYVHTHTHKHTNCAAGDYMMTGDWVL